MKPRNAFQRAVLEQSRHLPSLTQDQGEWAFRETIYHYAFRLPKGKVTCMDCGHSWEDERLRTDEVCICPHCGAKLTVKDTRQRKERERAYFNVLATFGGYQVLRMFLLTVEMEKGCPARPFIAEIGQYWWNDKGKEAIVAIQRTMGRYLDCFSYASPFAIRRDNVAYRFIARQEYYPETEYIDTLRRNGFNGDTHGISPALLIPRLLTDPKAETLLKAGQYAMLQHYLCSPSLDMGKYWASVKICIRNHYVIEDGSIWCDHIDQLRHFGKDIHSPKYVCPQDLKQEHQRLTLKRNEEENREKRAEQRETAREKEATYKEQKGCFFGLVFTDDTLKVRVLESVADFVDEGLSMHHCVYANGYYSKENSLILSATMDGMRIETVEVDLRSLTVVQSRGVCNQLTDYHDRIVALVNRNMNQIRQRMKAA